MRLSRAAALIPLLLPLLLAACDGGAASTGAPGAAAGPSDPMLDGDWRGTSTRFQVDSRHCPGPSLLEFQVFNRIFQYRWMRDVMIDVTVAADGSLSGSNGEVTITGKYDGTQITGDATTTYCGLHFTAVRRS